MATGTKKVTKKVTAKPKVSKPEVKEPKVELIVSDYGVVFTQDYEVFDHNRKVIEAFKAGDEVCLGSKASVNYFCNKNVVKPLGADSEVQPRKAFAQ